MQVTPETGFKVPANHPDQAVRDLSKVMVTLAKDPELRLRMGQAGQKLVTEAYSWQVKGEGLAKVYEEVVALKQKNLDTAPV